MLIGNKGKWPFLEPAMRDWVEKIDPNEDPTPVPKINPYGGTVDERMFEFLVSHEVRRGDRGRKVVLMTYDDQGYRSWIEKLLDVYQEARAKTTFFFTGDNLRLYTEQIRRIVSEGHVFASHGLVHTPYTALSSEEIRTHVRTWLAMAEEIVPDYRVRYFRFPYGDRDMRVRSVIAEFGLQSVQWTIESGGLEKSTFENVVEKVKNGSIVLGHMNRYYDVEYAERILAHLMDEGYSVESIETGREARDKFHQKRRPSRPGYPEPQELCFKE
jgi:peptidoglycan/xylan/chitin deacetylase (PgdA/CDA1 family)